MTENRILRIVGHRKCNKCHREIAITRQYETDNGFEYETENLPERYVDKWGYERNFCKDCMK